MHTLRRSSHPRWTGLRTECFSTSLLPMNDGFNLSRIGLLQPLVLSGYVSLHALHSWAQVSLRSVVSEY